MKEIKLTQGKVTIVDNEDFEWLSRWSWCLSNGYALRATNRGDRIYMHREVNKTPKGLETDHINRDKLDNRKENLRSVTHAVNGWNKPKYKNNKCGVKGVYWHKKTAMYTARIAVNKRVISLGYYHELSDAEKARKRAELVYHAA